MKKNCPQTKSATALLVESNTKRFTITKQRRKLLSAKKATIATIGFGADCIKLAKIANHKKIPVDVMTGIFYVVSGIKVFFQYSQSNYTSKEY